MKVSELKQLYVGTQDIEVNPLNIAENHYFNAPSTDANYRDLAINSCIVHKLSFNSTPNSFTNLLKRYVKVTCPVCGKELTGKGGGGTAKSNHVDYTCECGVKVFINCDPSDGFSVQFPKEK